MSDKVNHRSAGCLFLFALPFAGIGIFMFGLTAWALSDWWRMQSWVEVPALVLEAHLEERRDDDGTTYRAVARYKYNYQGVNYEGDRVGVDTTGDNLGNFHERKVAELQRKMSRSQPVPCFVNPASPERSVLYREFRLEKLAFYLLFGLVFGGAGGGILIYSFYARRQLRKSDSLRQEHPDQPWMWREDWAEGNVRSSSKTSMLAAVSFAIMWNLISSPVLFLLPAEVRKENYLALIGLLFPVVGVGLIIWAFISARRWVKYGESTFQAASVPGVVGGPLAGVVHTTAKLRPEQGFRQTLTCLRKVTSGSGEHRSTREDVLWQSSRVIQQELAADSTTSAIPVQFHIPYDAEPTTPSGATSPVLWRLEIQADAPGVDYHASFEVPVFHTADSSPDYQPDDSAISQYVREESMADVYRECGIRRHETVRGIRIEFPLFRNWAAALGATVFLSIWMGAIVLMIHLGAPLLFPIAFGLFALLIFWLALELWLWRSVTEVNPQGVSVRAGLVGLSSTQSFDRSQIETVTSKTGMQSGRTLYYDLQLTTKDGKSYDFGKRVANQAAAQAIVDDVRQVLGFNGSLERRSDESIESSDVVAV